MYPVILFMRSAPKKISTIPEKYIRAETQPALSKKAPAKPKADKKRDKFFSEVELALVDNLGRKVKIKENGKKGSGVLEIEFFDRDDLESLALQLENYGK